MKALLLIFAALAAMGSVSNAQSLIGATIVVPPTQPTTSDPGCFAWKMSSNGVIFATDSLKARVNGRTGAMDATDFTYNNGMQGIIRNVHTCVVRGKQFQTALVQVFPAAPKVDASGNAIPQVSMDVLTVLINGDIGVH